MQKKSYKIAINWIQEPTLGTKLKVAAQIYGKTFVIGKCVRLFKMEYKQCKKGSAWNIVFAFSGERNGRKILSDDQTEAVVKEVYLVLPDSFKAGKRYNWNDLRAAWNVYLLYYLSFLCCDSVPIYIRRITRRASCFECSRKDCYFAVTESSDGVCQVLAKNHYPQFKGMSFLILMICFLFFHNWSNNFRSK